MGQPRIGAQSMVLSVGLLPLSIGGEYTTSPTLRLFGILHWVSRFLASCWKSLMVSFASSIWSWTFFLALVTITTLLSNLGAQVLLVAVDNELRILSSFHGLSPHDL